MGQELPDSGSFNKGETVKVSYVDQQHADIDGEKTIWEQITGGNEIIELGKKEINSRAYVAGSIFQDLIKIKKLKPFLEGREIDFI